jgi:hypothetical protein
VNGYGEPCRQAFSVGGASGLPLVFVIALLVLVPAALTAQRPARRGE